MLACAAGTATEFRQKTTSLPAADAKGRGYDKDEHLSSEQEVRLPWYIILSPNGLKLGNFLSWIYDLLFSDLDGPFFPLCYLRTSCLGKIHC